MKKYIPAILLAIFIHWNSYAQYCFYVADSGDDLYSYINGVDSKICDLPSGIDFVEALGINPATGDLYIVEDGTAYLLNNSTCQLTTLFTGAPSDVDGLEFRNNRLIISTRVEGSPNPPDSIVEYDLSGNITNGPYAIEGTSVPEDVDAIAVHPKNGEIYFVANNGSSGNDSLFTIDISTGSITFQSKISIADVEGITFDPSGNMYALSGGTPSVLYDLNPSTGSATNPTTLTGIDVEGINCEADIVLPLQLKYFTARKMSSRNVKLQWQTEVGSAFDHFVVQRQLEGEDDFKNLGEVGNVQAGSFYEYEDRIPMGAGTAFYRLLNIDINGSKNYSSVQSVSAEDKTGLLVYPNPAHDIIYLTGLESSMLYDLQIVDSYGAIVKYQKGISGDLELIVSDIPVGLYSIYLTSTHSQQISRIVVTE